MEQSAWEGLGSSPATAWLQEGEEKSKQSTQLWLDHTRVLEGPAVSGLHASGLWTTEGSREGARQLGKWGVGRRVLRAAAFYLL